MCKLRNQPVQPARRCDYLGIVDEDDQQSAAAQAATHWRQLVRHARRLRKLQRLWGYLGQKLATYDVSVRHRLRITDPTDYQRRHGTRSTVS